MRWLAPLAILLLAAAACSDEDQAPPPSVTTMPAPTLTPTLPPATSPPNLPPTATATPDPAVIHEVERVWVYADSAVLANTCAELLGEMIPTGAPDNTAGKAVECRTGAELARTGYSRRPDGTLQLDSILLLILLDANYPQDGGVLDCTNAVDYMLPETANPASVEDGGDATYIGVCGYTPPVRGEPLSVDEVIWGRIDGVLEPPGGLPSGLPCWQTTLFIGPGGHLGEIRDVTCRLQLP